MTCADGLARFRTQYTIRKLYRSTEPGGVNSCTAPVLELLSAVGSLAEDSHDANDGNQKEGNHHGPTRIIKKADLRR